MSTTVVVHSFMRDSRKANITAELAGLAMADGLRTAVIEANVLMPVLHSRYHLDIGRLSPTFNDYLMGTCHLADAAVDLGNPGDLTGSGKLVFVPASVDPAQMDSLLQRRVDLAALDSQMKELTDAYALDIVFINAPSGLDEISLSCIALADVLIVVLILDEEDTHGTSVTLDLAERLNVPLVLLVVNRVSEGFPLDEVRREVEGAYGYRAPVVLTAEEESEMMFGTTTSPLNRATSPLAPLLRAILADV